MRARQGGPVGRVGVALVFHLVVTIVLLVDIRVVSAERERVQLRVSGKSCFYFLLYATCFQSLGRILLSQKSHSSIFLNNTIMSFIWWVCLSFCLADRKTATFFAYLCFALIHVLHSTRVLAFCRLHEYSRKRVRQIKIRMQR